MNYPEELLPKKNYIIIDTNNLPNDSSLIRKSLLPKEDSIDSLGDIRLDAICENNRAVPGLSTSLFSIYECIHMKYSPDKKEYNEYWYPGMKLFNPGEIEFSILEEYFPIFFNIFELHGQIFPYQKSTSGKEKDFDLFHGSISIEHKPTLCNFWHFEFRIYGADNKLIKKTDSAWKKQVAEFLSKSFLKENASSKIPVQINLEKKVYMR